MKNSLFFLFLMPLLALNAQTINIDWQGLKVYSKGFENNTNLPFFSNEGYEVYNDIPQLYYMEPVVGMGRISVENVQFAPLAASERGQLNVQEIPTELKYYAKINKGMSGYFATVRLTPFVKQGTQIRKVVSFQIVTQMGLSQASQVAGTYDPATQSVLRSGNWYKIKVGKSGIFRLDKSFFEQNGIPTDFDPRTLKIYGNGGEMLNENPGDFRYGALQENAIQFNGESDGSFDNGDFILFYAQGPDDWYRKPDSTINSLYHKTHVFDDYAYYFITYGGGAGKRVQDENISGSAVQIFNQYDEYVAYENDSINLNQMGRQWGGESFTMEPNQSFTLIGNGSATGQVVARSRMLGKDAEGASLSITLNGAIVDQSTFASGPFNVQDGLETISATGNTFTFNISVGDSSNPSAFVFLDYLEVKYVANLTFNGTQMQFRKLQNLNDGNVYGFSISGPQKVWNISDITTAKNVVNSGGIYKYQSTSPYFLNEFIAFNESAAFTEIEYVGSVANQNLRAYTDVDYVIVTHPDYLSEAARLANFRITHDNVNVKVVTTDQVYNEFSSGAKDISAIRDFFKHLRDTGSPLKYTLLFGGASYDYKDRILDNTNFVPTYISFRSDELDQTFATDDFFTMLDDTDTIMDSTTGPSEYEGSTTQMDIA